MSTSFYFVVYCHRGRSRGVNGADLRAGDLSLLHGDQLSVDFHFCRRKRCTAV